MKNEKYQGRAEPSHQPASNLVMYPGTWNSEGGVQEVPCTELLGDCHCNQRLELRAADPVRRKRKRKRKKSRQDKGQGIAILLGTVSDTATSTDPLIGHRKRGQRNQKKKKGFLPKEIWIKITNFLKAEEAKMPAIRGLSVR